MSNTGKILILVVVLLAMGAGLVFWKSKVSGHPSEAATRLSKEEMEALLKDANPMVLKKLADDPKEKKDQVKNIKQLLALAAQARKEGIADEPNNKSELENIRAEIVASNYDKSLNEGKGPMPPFGYIGEDRVKEYWGDPEAGNFFTRLWSGGESRRREAEFQKFLDTKIALMKAKSPQKKEPEITEDQKTQAKDFFAKMKIYEAEYDQKAAAGQITPEVQDKTNLQVKLQQASFLASLYAEKLADKMKVNDDDINKYLGEHPELSIQEKKNKAQEILNRAKGGEDFAKLAKENSDDPGSKDNGGLYPNVTKGKMMPEFETAALALEPGQISPDLVETPYGYHIIKLEKKTDAKDAQGQPTQTYDVRHILISTGVKDPENPQGREMPVKDFVRSKLEQSKQDEVLDNLIAENKIEVADDFVVPPVTDEQIQQVQQQQMQQMMQQQGMKGGMPPGAGAPPNGKTPPKPPAPPKGK